METTKDSPVYTHLGGADIEKKILEINNIKTEKEGYNSVILKPKNCFRCQYKNNATSKFCSRCGAILDVKQYLNLENNGNDFQQFLIELFQKWKSDKRI